MIDALQDRIKADWPSAKVEVRGNALGVGFGGEFVAWRFGDSPSARDFEIVESLMRDWLAHGSAGRAAA